jgi:hypothetical protein
MTVPTEADFALIKMGDGATTEVFTTICGLQDVNCNATANTSDRSVPDCAKPGKKPKRRVRVTGLQLDVTGSGLIDIDQIASFQAALGKSKHYEIELYQDDGTDTGLLLGTFSGTFVLTAANLSIQRTSDSSAEVTLPSDGDWEWAAAA